MEYLGELEMGYAEAPNIVIGFPSVMGCMAIGFLTTTRLFALHLSGNANMAQRAANFANFVLRHVPEVGLQLYGCTVDRPRTDAENQLLIFADALHFAGPIRLAHGVVAHGSAYVEFRAMAHEVLIYYKQWNDALITAPMIHNAALDQHVSVQTLALIQDIYPPLNAMGQPGINNTGLSNTGGKRIH
jgi:hypothetical protein